VRFSLNLLGLASPIGTTAGVGAITGNVAPGAGSQR